MNNLVCNLLEASMVWWTLPNKVSLNSEIWWFVKQVGVLYHSKR